MNGVFMGIASVKSFFSVAKPTGKLIVTRTATTITKWEKGGETFKKSCLWRR